jgi:hypothetical protein
MGVAAPLSNDDYDNDEFEVFIGRPCIQASKRVSLLEVAGTAQSALHMVQHVFQRE